MDAVTRPTSVRLRRPGWRDPRLVVGVLLIAVAVVGTTWALKAADRTAPVYAARATLVPGTVLEEGDLVLARVRVGEGYLEAPAAEPWGKVVVRTVAAGELVPEAALTDTDSFDGRPVAITVGMPLAAGVGPGSVVDVWVTPEDGAPSRQIGAALTVTDVHEDTGALGGEGPTVYVMVPAEDVGEFLDSLARAATVTVVGMG